MNIKDVINSFKGLTSYESTIARTGVRTPYTGRQKEASRHCVWDCNKFGRIVKASIVIKWYNATDTGRDNRENRYERDIAKRQAEGDSK